MNCSTNIRSTRREELKGVEGEEEEEEDEVLGSVGGGGSVIGLVAVSFNCKTVI